MVTILTSGAVERPLVESPLFCPTDGYSEVHRRALDVCQGTSANMTPYVYAAAGAALLLGGFFTGVKVTNLARMNFQERQLPLETEWHPIEHIEANDRAVLRR